VIRVVANKVDSTAAELFQRIVEKTPVDTGAAREAWEMEVNGSGLNRTATIRNPLPYALLLEHGSSEQAPLGMVAVSIAEITKR
jgi:hypothetical protein